MCDPRLALSPMAPIRNLSSAVSTSSGRRRTFLPTLMAGIFRLLIRRWNWRTEKPVRCASAFNEEYFVVVWSGAMSGKIHQRECSCNCKLMYMSSLHKLSRQFMFLRKIVDTPWNAETYPCPFNIAKYAPRDSFTDVPSNDHTATLRVSTITIMNQRDVKTLTSCPSLR